PPCAPHSRAPHFCSFLFMPRLPPSPTLFPYTTLFRSLPCHRLAGRRGRGVRRGGGLLRCLRHQCHAGPGRTRAEGEDIGAGHHPDRKSTRLNSSHVKISYAVFCLKKKICTNKKTFDHS